MEFYTKEQVDLMLSNCVNNTTHVIDEGGVIDDLAASRIVQQSYLHPHTGKQEEIQKQIEAVRGLIEAHNNLLRIVMVRYGGDGEYEDEISTIKDSIGTLTATLKPYLNGEKLEV